MNDLSLYGLEEGVVLADLNDLMNLLGNPYPEPEGSGGQGGQGKGTSVGQGKGTSGGDSENSQSGGSESDEEGSQNGQGGSGGGQESLQEGQSGSQNEQGGSQGLQEGQDGQGGSQNGENASQSGQGGQSGASGTGESLEQMLERMGKGIQTGGNFGKQEGLDSSMLSDTSPEQSAFFGDDLGESMEDFKHRMRSGRPSWGDGSGAQRKSVDFRGLHVDMDEYANSEAADIFASDKNGEDRNDTEEVKKNLRKLIKEAKAQYETNKQLVEALEHEQMAEEERQKRLAALRQGGITARDIFGRVGSVDWHEWLSKRLAPHMEVVDVNYYGDKRLSGRQAAYASEGIFLGADERQKVRNGARIELYFDTSGSVGPDQMALFFREVAQLMHRAKCDILRTPNGRKAWNNLVKLYIYCWDGSVLCNAPVKTPEELLDIANRTHGGGGTDPNCIFQFKKYNDGLAPLPRTQKSNTGVVYLDNMTNSEYEKYLKSREERLGKKQLKAIKNTLTIVFTDYGFSAVRKDWVTRHPEWSRMSDPDRSNLLWVCLPNCVHNIKEARELTPFGDICLM